MSSSVSHRSVSHRSVSHRMVPAALCLAMSLGCASILDLDEATFDPDAGTKTTNVGTGGTGNGGTGNGGTGNGGTASGGTGGTPTGDPCDLYCTLVGDNCTGESQVYQSEDACRATCAILRVEVESDPQAVSCRTEQARLAGTVGEKNIHCPAAGPGGNGVCGSDNCTSYCSIMLSTCGDAFTDIDECIANCDTAVDLGGYDVSKTAGDSVQCRLYHVTAATLAPSTHCGHSAGLNPCACTAQISDNHVLDLTGLDLGSGEGATFEFSGADAEHVHSITLSAAQVDDLSAGNIVEVQSDVGVQSQGFPHSHIVSINCGL